MTRTTDDSQASSTERLADKVTAMAAESDAARQSFFDASTNAVTSAVTMIVEAIRNERKLLIFGNGGSAADAQHIAAELVFRMGRLRAALPAIALTTDTSVLTAIANDRSFDYVFARQIEALGREGDVVLAISTSGNSQNVVEAVVQARHLGLKTIGLLGGEGGAVRTLVDLALIVPHPETPRIQETHLLIAHIMCQLIEDELFPQD